MDAPDTPKEEEQHAMQTLVSLLAVGTPTKTIQEPSIVAVPLQISTLGSSASHVEKVIRYGETFLDEEIVIQATLEKKK